MPSQIIMKFKKLLEECLKFYANQGLALEACSLLKCCFVTSFQALKVIYPWFQKDPIEIQGNRIPITQISIYSLSKWLLNVDSLEAQTSS